MLNKDLELIKANENFFEIIFKRFPSGLFFYDANLIIVDWNERLVQILGSSNEKLRDFDLKSIKDRRILPALNKSLDGDEGYYEGPYLPTTGTVENWVLLRTAPLYSKEGKLFGGIGIFEDLTAEKLEEVAAKECEDRYRETLGNLNDSIYIADSEGTIKFISTVIKTITGFEEKEVVGKKILSFVYPDDLPAVTERLKKILEGQKLGPLEFRITKKDGGNIYIQTHSRPILKDGKIVGINGIISDISVRKQLEAEAKERSESFENLNRIMVNRELKMIELKEELEEMKSQLIP